MRYIPVSAFVNHKIANFQYLKILLNLCVTPCFIDPFRTGAHKTHMAESRLILGTAAMTLLRTVDRQETGVHSGRECGIVNSRDWW
ncbi:hypothetical protein HYE67_009912 [Fusarium culmorum]|uniref:Uncharacterized protein n=1 Tax=Fusarium culmorum TaxID=5516 RepID=A0A2T4HCD9_FUSCU|nr:hypothetical protein FCULG_00004854 [Fusarium culmorum]QPC67681.1 hypothetical protein HYE67_009912 [Fusarium culmorum]